MTSAKKADPGVRWGREQWALAAAGVISFALGASVHKDRGTLAVTLVGLGVLLAVVAVLLPRIQTLSGKLGGLELTLGLVDRPTMTTDREMAAASTGGLPHADLRGVGAPPSGMAGFADATRGGPADLVTINLEDGQAWLTSRLYAFVAVLVELRNVQAVVFTHRQRSYDVVLGIAPSCAILGRLGWAYPWLPAELAASWDELRTGSQRPDSTRLAGNQADELFARYLNRLWRREPSAVDRDLPGQWTRLDSGQLEHASLLDTPLVESLLGVDLTRAWVREPAPAAERVPGDPYRAERAALAYVGTRWVAVVSAEHELRSIIDRFAVLEAMRPRP